MNSNIHFIIFNVYGPIKTKENLSTWMSIENQMKELKQLLMILCGDFNVILDIGEKNGGLKKINRNIQDLKDLVEDNGLVECATSNGTYTWTNKRRGFTRILERLDRFFISPCLLNDNFQIEALTLPISFSDHFPVNLEIKVNEGPIKTTFKFESMWWRDEILVDHLEK